MINDADPLIILLFHVAILICICLRIHSTAVFSPTFTFYLCLLIAYGLLVTGDMERVFEWSFVAGASRRYAINGLTLFGFALIVWRGDSRAEQKAKMPCIADESLLNKMEHHGRAS